MAYLDNSAITLDAVLTKRGRDLLAQGQDNFSITQFAFSDDEIDYALWNASHPSGSDSFGNIIENTPVLEAITDENQVMKYKLVSIPNVTNTLTRVYLPQILLNDGQISANSTVTVKTRKDTEVIYTLAPATKLTVTGTSITDYSLDKTKGYTFKIGKSAETLLNTNGLFSDTSDQIYTNLGSRSDKSSIERSGMQLTIKLRKREDDFSDVEIPITVTGNETGAIFEFILSVSNTD